MYGEHLARKRHGGNLGLGHSALRNLTTASYTGTDEPVYLPDFTMRDKQGRSRTKDDLGDGYVVLNLGSIVDPGLMDSNLARQSDLVDMTGGLPDGVALVPVFVVVEEVSPPKLGPVLQAGHPRTLGLCGCDSKKIHAAAKRFLDTSDEQAVHMVDPEALDAVLFIIAPDGEFLSAYGSDANLDTMAQDTADDKGGDKGANVTEKILRGEMGIPPRNDPNETLPPAYSGPPPLETRDAITVGGK
ncbi:hypothetical protein WJX72_010139 [[Myrmecia] bisecta]|uniref:Uncharacterized protein n=1 Tax=[Myrmecia] bisecta TaxID=41462 RepID=A0AAW1QTE1_9CHLO